MALILIRVTPRSDQISPSGPNGPLGGAVSVCFSRAPAARRAGQGTPLARPDTSGGPPGSWPTRASCLFHGVERGRVPGARRGGALRCVSQRNARPLAISSEDHRRVPRSRAANGVAPRHGQRTGIETRWARLVGTAEGAGGSPVQPGRSAVATPTTLVSPSALDRVTSRSSSFFPPSSRLAVTTILVESTSSGQVCRAKRT
jgi:hypothetical protein